MQVQRKEEAAIAAAGLRAAGIVYPLERETVGGIPGVAEEVAVA